MTTTRRLLSLLLTWAIAAIPTAALAQTNNTLRRSVTMQYDLDSTTGISCAFNPPRPIPIAVSAAASTTLAATTASTSPFALASVGDAVEINTGDINTGGARVRRLITAKASADSVTIDAATTVTARTFQLFISSCGTTATSGFIPVTSRAIATLSINVEQLSVASGGIAFKIEGYLGDDPDHRNLTNLWPGESSAGSDCAAGTFAAGFCVFTTVGNLPIFTSTPYIQVSFIRVWMKLSGADDGADTGANAEKVTINYAGLGLP